jgi:hypothetical protein
MPGRAAIDSTGRAFGSSNGPGASTIDQLIHPNGSPLDHNPER